MAEVNWELDEETYDKLYAGYVDAFVKSMPDWELEWDADAV